MVLFKLSALCGLVAIADAFGPAARSIVNTPTILERADQLNAEYDYVIVGGGTAGLTVADRLTESGKYSVLVIEYGVFQNGTAVTTVGLGFLGLTDPALSFNFTSVPQTGLGGRTVDVLVGKMLGGSSGHNGLQVHRGQKDDYDRWGSYFGPRSSWSWDSLLPYFKKAWHFHPPSNQLATEHSIKYDAKYWGATSKIHASWPTFLWPFLKKEVAAFGEISGVQSPPDSGAGVPGVFWYPTSADPGPMLRSFSRPGHWDGIEAARKNYHTLTGHQVLKVLFKQGCATGVSFVPVGSTSVAGALTVKAKKEVIVAAGTIHTPKILQASGVGPKQLLRDAGIDVVVDLPGVGSNFQDHAFQVGASFSLNNFPFHPDPDDLFFNATFIAEAQAEFDANRTGPLTIASGNAGAFLPLGVISASSVVQDIARRYEAQDPASYLPAGTDRTVVAGYQAQKKALAAAMRSKNSAFYNLFLRGSSNEGAVVYLHPLSRGTVLINPADPFFSPPRVDYRALSNPADGEVLVEFTRFTRKYWQQTSLKQYDPVEVTPGANVTAPADIIADLRTRMIPSVFHPIGTAAMMPRELGGVVDQNLLVYGVKGLSVVDASVFPDLPGAYTQQTVYAVAEKAADSIKARA